jgi:hypothetical protein
MPSPIPADFVALARVPGLRPGSLNKGDRDDLDPESDRLVFIVTMSRLSRPGRTTGCGQLSERSHCSLEGPGLPENNERQQGPPPAAIRPNASRALESSVADA